MPQRMDSAPPSTIRGSEEDAPRPIFLEGEERPPHRLTNGSCTTKFLFRGDFTRLS